MADSIHCIKKTLRLKPAEAEVLALKAAEAGMCEAGYLRLLITQKPYDYPETRMLLKALINEVNAVGNNINQITRASNSYFYSREDKEVSDDYKYLEKYVGDERNGYPFTNLRMISFSHFLQHLW